MATIESLPTLFLLSALKNERAAAHKRFEAFYPVVRDDFLETFRRLNLPDEAIERCLRVRPSTDSSSTRLKFLSLDSAWTTTSLEESSTEA
jgi:hypothetical protein